MVMIAVAVLLVAPATLESTRRSPRPWRAYKIIGGLEVNPRSLWTAEGIGYTGLTGEREGVAPKGWWPHAALP